MRDLLSEAPTSHPGWLIHLVQWLPEGGAVAAVYLERGSETEPADPGVRRWLGWDTDRHLRASIWDALAAANTGKGKPPQYPRPKRRARSAGFASEYQAIRDHLRRRRDRQA